LSNMDGEAPGGEGQGLRHKPVERRTILLSERADYY
jgi:hypothetical protein